MKILSLALFSLVTLVGCDIDNTPAEQELEIQSQSIKKAQIEQSLKQTVCCVEFDDDGSGAYHGWECQAANKTGNEACTALAQDAVQAETEGGCESLEKPNC
jgi:hypothetical protein